MRPAADRLQYARVAAGMLLAALALLLTACSALPARAPQPPTHAWAAPEATSLGRIAAASLPEAAAGASGFRLLPSGEFSFTARTALAARAERTIDAQYYHIHEDAAGAAFLRELRDAARRGVRVRLLVDDYHAGAVERLLVGLAAQDGVEVRLFNPLPLRIGPPLLRIALAGPAFERANHRMHNKLFVADNAVAIFGGRNVADEYFMRHGAANFIDLDVLSTGAVVRALSGSFDEFWNSEHAVPLADLVAPMPDRAQARAEFERRVQAMPFGPQRHPPTDPLGQTSVGEQLDAGRLALSAGHAELYADPPSKVTAPVQLYHPSEALRGQIEVFSRARSAVTIVTPYFVPGEMGMRLMAEAASAGRRTVVYTNSLASTDEPVVHAAYAAYRVEMLRLGVELHELAPALVRRHRRLGDFGASLSRLHAKAAMVDRRWLLFGSVNLDARSALYNTELSVAIDCPPLVQHALQLLEDTNLNAMYRLRLAADGSTIEWLSTDADGRVHATREEPHASWPLRLKTWLQSLFIDESLL